jgi:hypothetical protein
VLSSTAATESDLRVEVGDCSRLLELLSLVPDPRRPRGIRHRVAGLLAVAAAAVLAGANSVLAIGEWTAEAPQSVLAALGARFSPRHDRFVAAHTDTFRRVLRIVNAAAVDTAIGLFVAERSGAEALFDDDEPAGADLGEQPGADSADQDDEQPVVGALAVDGKAARGARQPDGRAVHLLSAMLHQASAVVAQRDVHHKTNEVRREALCRIPNSVRRDSEDSFWDRWLTRSRKVMGTRACHEYRRSCPDARSGAPGSPRDTAKAGLPEPQSPAMQLFIHRNGV